MTREREQSLVQQIGSSQPEFLRLSDAPEVVAVVRRNGFPGVVGVGLDEPTAFADALSNLVQHMDGQNGRIEMEHLDLPVNPVTGEKQANDIETVRTGFMKAVTQSTETVNRR